MRTPWRFELPSASQSYYLQINPREFQRSKIDRPLTKDSTAAGRTIVFEGLTAPEKLSMSGTLLTKDQYDALVLWSSTEKQIKITDDLGQVFWVYITQFRPSRQRSVESPWRHTFQIDAVVVSW